MNRKRALIWGFFGAITIAIPAALKGCETTPGAHGPGDRPISDEPWDGPEVSVQVITQRPWQEEEVNLAIIEMVVPTGGHLLHLDHADIRDEVAHLYLTLEKPGHNESVTQALETLYQQHQSTADEPFESARPYLRAHRRSDPIPRAYHRTTPSTSDSTHR